VLHVSLRQLEYIVAVGKSGSLSAAAEALHVSQPAMSVAIAHVEDRVGEKLFLRRKGVAITPTPFGRIFLHEAEELLADAARLEEPNGLSHRQQSRVVLAILDELAPRWLAPILAEVGRAFPQTELRALPLSFERLTEALLSGHADIGLTYDLGLDASFRRDLLVSAVPRVWVRPDDSLAQRSSVSLAEIADRPLILSDQALSIHHMLGLFRRIGVTPMIKHRATSIELLRSLAANGEGTGLSYTNPAGTVSSDGSPITSVPIEDPFVAEPVVLTYLAALPEPQKQISLAILRLK
jgi:DNA-binding transcriptional LysR family regulator